MPAPLLRKQTEFAIKATNLDASIQEEDSTECLGARLCVNTITTTNSSITTRPKNREDKDISNFTSLGKTDTKSLD